MPIYTKTGDDGTTSLFGGKRVLKCDELIDVFGSLDELNSWVGLLQTDKLDTPIHAFLTLVQSDLFTIGCTLAGWNGDLSSVRSRVGEMEKQIDGLASRLPELTNFILPGGTIGASRVHIARSICRRVERQTVALAQKQNIDPDILKYLNRLSDLLFELARTINKNANVPEAIWSGIRKK
jgi:cob(I)alamin adenosyltransferase